MNPLIYVPRLLLHPTGESLRLYYRLSRGSPWQREVWTRGKVWRIDRRHGMM